MRGLSNREIAAKLEYSDGGVTKIRNRVFSKLLRTFPPASYARMSTSTSWQSRPVRMLCTLQILPKPEEEQAKFWRRRDFIIDADAAQIDLSKPCEWLRFALLNPKARLPALFDKFSKPIDEPMEEFELGIAKCIWSNVAGSEPLQEIYQDRIVGLFRSAATTTQQRRKFLVSYADSSIALSNRVADGLVELVKTDDVDGQCRLEWSIDILLMDQMEQLAATWDFDNDESSKDDLW